MKTHKASLLYTFILSLTLVSAAYCQTIGKIYSKTEADSIYGKVYSSLPVSTSKLQSYCSKTSNYILLNIVQGKLVLLNNKRNIISPNTAAVSDTLVFKVCSVSKMLELFAKGGKTETYIEQRQNVITVTNGDYTIEEMVNCPPHCP